MHSRSLRGPAVLLILIATTIARAQAPYKIKEEKTALPTELKAPIAKLLDENAVKFFDSKETLLCEVWFRAEVPTKAPTEAKDPIGGMTVEMATARHQSDWAGRSVYFCCLRCKEIFDADPQRYAAALSD